MRNGPPILALHAEISGLTSGGFHCLCAPVSFPSRHRDKLLSDPGVTIVPPGPGWGSFFISIVLLALLLWGFVDRAGERIEKEYREAALTPAETYYKDLVLSSGTGEDREAGVMEKFTNSLPHRTDGVTGPLWPWLMARATTVDGKGDHDLVRRGKWVQVWAMAGFLELLGIIAAAYFSPAAVLLMLVPAAFTVLLPDSVAYGPRALNDVLVFLLWACAARLLRRNSVWLHAVFGVIAGLAWLMDTSAWIPAGAWLLASTCRWLREALRRGEGGSEGDWTCRNHFLGLVALTLGWAVVCAPRCGAAADRWGHPFFSWQQQWMWFENDNPVAPREWARLHPTREEISHVPETERPSFENYRRTHTPQQIQLRLLDGFEKVGREFVNQGVPGTAGEESSWRQALAPRGLYPAMLLGLLAVLWGVTVLNGKGVDRDGLRMPGGTWAGVLFVALACAGYGAWYGWSSVILPNGLTVIYLPLMFSLASGLEGLMTLARMRGTPPWSWRAWQVILWLVLAAGMAGLTPVF